MRSGQFWHQNMLLLEAVLPDFGPPGRHSPSYHMPCRQGGSGEGVPAQHPLQEPRRFEANPGDCSQRPCRSCQGSAYQLQLEWRVRFPHCLRTQRCWHRSQPPPRQQQADTVETEGLQRRHPSPHSVQLQLYWRHALILEADSDSKMKITMLTTDTGETLLQVACTMNFHKAVALLIQHDRGSIHYCNLKGENAPHTACLHTSPKIAQCIQRVSLLRYKGLVFSELGETVLNCALIFIGLVQQICTKPWKQTAQFPLPVKKILFGILTELSSQGFKYDYTLSKLRKHLKYGSILLTKLLNNKISSTLSKLQKF